VLKYNLVPIGDEIIDTDSSLLSPPEGTVVWTVETVISPIDTGPAGPCP